MSSEEMLPQSLRTVDPAITCQLFELAYNSAEKLGLTGQERDEHIRSNVSYLLGVAQISPVPAFPKSKRATPIDMADGPPQVPAVKLDLLEK